MSAKPLGIIELLTRVGEDNVLMQNLLESATNLQTRKGGGTAVTFVTNQITPTAAVAPADKIGIVVWLPTGLVAQAKADHDRESEQGS